MRSVLASTPNKDYAQVAHAFEPTCQQRFGVTREVELCKADRLADRSQALAELIDEETEAWLTASDGAVRGANPLELLTDERTVQRDPTRLVWLFAPCLTALYQRHHWDQLRRLEQYSIGAHLIASLVLATARTGELTTSGESADLLKFHELERQWLNDYLFGRSCDADCKGRLLEVMLTNFAEAQGDFDEQLRRVLELPRSEVGTAVGRLHARMIRCQVDNNDLSQFRDRVLVPALTQVLSRPKVDPGALDDLIDLMSLAPEPTDPTMLHAWNDALAKLQKTWPERHRRGFVERRAWAERERNNPPAAARAVSFCHIAETPAAETNKP
jgi:hypothetical protein